MKKSKAGLLAVVLGSALALSACSGVSSGNSNSSASSSAKSGPYKIGYSTFFEGNSWQAQNVKLFNDQCKALGASVAKTCTVQNANGSTTQQIAQIQGMINQGYDAILLDANTATGLNPVVKTAMSKGIKVVNFDTLVTGPATSKINTDQLQWGSITGQWLVDKLHGKGNIIVLNGLAGNSTSEERYRNAKALFAKTPGIKVLGTANANWDQAAAQTAVSQMLNAYPQIDGVWSQGGAMTAGAIIEFQKAGRKLVPMTGEDYNGFLKLWSANKSKGFSSVSPGQPNYLVTLSLNAAVRSLKGQAVPAKVNVPLPVITDNTVGQYYKPSESDSYWTMNDISKSQIDKLLATH
jgi:ribose transport system substrate-binding protein